jgi:hypothetical protein
VVVGTRSARVSVSTVVVAVVGTEVTVEDLNIAGERERERSRSDGARWSSSLIYEREK